MAHPVLAPATQAARVLNRVVDSLDLRLSKNCHPSAWLVEQLPAWRAFAEQWFDSPDKCKPLMVDLGIGMFQVRPKGAPYEFVLINPEIADIRIWNPDKWPAAIGTQTGQFYISLRSRFLQFSGAAEAADTVCGAVERLMCGAPMRLAHHEIDNGEFCRVARADLAIDTEERRGMTWRDLDQYTCRARKRDIWLASDDDAALEQAFQSLAEAERGRVKAGITDEPLVSNKGGANYMREFCEAAGISPHTMGRVVSALKNAWGITSENRSSRIVAASRTIETVYFGRFGSALYARRYDKLASLDAQGKEYMRDVWASAGWDRRKPVWRTEFSISGDFLKEVLLDDVVHDVRELGIFLAAIPAIWAYLTLRWLRHHKGSNDKNVSRWQLSPLWEVISAAWDSEQPITRKQPVPKPVYEKLIAQFQGLALSIAAYRSSWRDRRRHDPDTFEVFEGVKYDELNGEIFDIPSSLGIDLARFFASAEAEAMLRERIQVYAMDERSDTTFSAMLRSERIAEGLGS